MSHPDWLGKDERFTFASLRHAKFVNNLKVDLLFSQFDLTMIKPGLHIVVTIAEHACDYFSKRILKPSTRIDSSYFKQKVNTYDHYNNVEMKPWPESLKNMSATMCLESLRLIWNPAFKFIILIFNRPTQSLTRYHKRNSITCWLNCRKRKLTKQTGDIAP